VASEQGFDHGVCRMCVQYSRVSARNKYIAAVISTFELIGLRSEVVQYEDRGGCCLLFCATKRTCRISSRRILLPEWEALGILEDKMIVGGYVLRAGGVWYRHFSSL
jgi:hypothetical protein